MNDFEDVVHFIIGIWLFIILVVTCPIWFLPVAIYKVIKG
jgi:hypothetical protein